MPITAKKNKRLGVRKVSRLKYFCLATNIFTISYNTEGEAP